MGPCKVQATLQRRSIPAVPNRAGWSSAHAGPAYQANTRRDAAASTSPCRGKDRSGTARRIPRSQGRNPATTICRDSVSLLAALTNYAYRCPPTSVGTLPGRMVHRFSVSEVPNPSSLAPSITRPTATMFLHFTILARRSRKFRAEWIALARSGTPRQPSNGEPCQRSPRS
jgi:hypothetical protein